VRRFLKRHFEDTGVRSALNLHRKMHAEKNAAFPAGIDRLSK
jgi:hypothetical protein